MKKFFSYVFASLIGSLIAGIIILIFGLGIIMGIAASSDEIKTINKHTVLAFDFKNQIVDHKSDNPFESINFTNMSDFKTTSLSTVLNNIKKAKTDDNIDGIFLRLSSINAGIAMVEEIRNALLDFKESGKFIITHSNSYSHKSYYLASVSDKIYLTPEGGLQFVGLSAEIMFYKNLLKKLDIEPIIIRHGKFKSAVEPFMLEKMSKANREQTATYINDIWNHLVSGISKQRNISVDQLNKIANDLLITTSSSCVDLGLVDSLKYYDELLAELKEKTEAESIKDINFTTLSDYDKVPAKDTKISRDKIAVIYAQGEIVDGEGKSDNIGGNSLSRTIRKVRNDDKVKAIVLRVNSPGGSALASEIIWREVKLAKEVKPVIVSMGNYAASGGYYISCPADTIVADPSTLTGSIGVFGLMFNIEKLMKDKLGVNIDKVNTNTHSDIGSMTRAMTTEEQAYIQKSVEDIYTTFITHVAEGRGMTTEAVDSIGQGRVWTGLKAKELGLVDVIAGLDSAIAIAANKVGLDKYRLVSYPKKKEPMEAILEAFGDIKAQAIEEEIGNFAIYYRSLKDIAERKGVQARIPMDIYIN